MIKDTRILMVDENASLENGIQEVPGDVVRCTSCRDPITGRLYAMTTTELYDGRPHKGDGMTTCYWCGKRLTANESINRGDGRDTGVGPVCIEKRGPMPRWIA
jgi:hypothetical protein